MNSLWQIFLSFVASGHYCKVCTVHVNVNISVARYSNAISNFFQIKNVKSRTGSCWECHELVTFCLFLIKMRIFLQRNAFSMYIVQVSVKLRRQMVQNIWKSFFYFFFFTFHYFNGRQIRTVLKLKISWVKLHLNEILYLFLY